MRNAGRSEPHILGVWGRILKAKVLGFESLQGMCPVHSLHRPFPFLEATDVLDPEFPLVEGEPILQTQKVNDSSLGKKKGYHSLPGPNIAKG